MIEKLFDSTVAFEQLIGNYVKSVNRVAMKDKFEVQKRLYKMMLDASPTQNYRSIIDDVKSRRYFDEAMEQAFLSSWKLDDEFVDVCSANRCFMEGSECWIVTYTVFIAHDASIFTVIYSANDVPKLDLRIFAI